MPRLRVLSVLLAGALVFAACSNDDEPSSDTTTTTEAQTVADAQAAFCESGEDYVSALDTYGQVFDDSEPTVGDLKEGVEPLKTAGDNAKAAGEDLEAAIAARAEEIAEEEAEHEKAVADAEAKGEEPPTTTTSTTVVDINITGATLEQVEAAQANLDAALEGISDDTPITEADVQLTSAAYELEVSWISLLLEAGCVDDPNSAYAQVQQYVASIQSDLTTAGYYTGDIDGVWGPETADSIKALQAANGLPETGYMDPPTQLALADELAGQESAQVSALQGVLTAMGFYTGPIDGVWTPQVEDSLKAAQEALGVPATGVIDEATLRAFQDRLAEAEEALNTTTTVAPETTAAPTAAPTTAAPTTAAP
jgi:peptidoglycan hydrolase-like protein with peptidoglycan-binding domain